MPETTPSDAVAPPIPPTDRIRTPLLALLTRESLDSDYQVAAARRLASGAPPERSGGGRVAVALAVGGFGLLVALAGVRTAETAGVDATGRETLIARIDGERADVRALQSDLADLRDANAAADDDLVELGAEVNTAEGRALALEVVTGHVAVVGEGITVTIENYDYADEPNEIIRSTDIMLVANALWTAGAEAIAVNGQRLTTTSSINNRGTSIEINGRGITPPYVFEAIGDAATMPGRLLDPGGGVVHGTGEYFFEMADAWAIMYDVDPDPGVLRLPAAPAAERQLRWAGDIPRDPRQEEGS